MPRAQTGPFVGPSVSCAFIPLPMRVQHVRGHINCRQNMCNNKLNKIQYTSMQSTITYECYCVVHIPLRYRIAPCRLQIICTPSRAFDDDDVGALTSWMAGWMVGWTDNWVEWARERLNELMGVVAFTFLWRPCGNLCTLLLLFMVCGCCYCYCCCSFYRIMPAQGQILWVLV